MTTQRWTSTILLASLLASLLLGSASALATNSHGACCACLAVPVAMQNGPPMPPPVAALFCGEFSMSEQSAASLRCDNLGGLLECAAPGTTGAAISGECRALLLEADVTCPQQAGVPLAGPWALAGLAVALGALGAAARRRR